VSEMRQCKKCLVEQPIENFERLPFGRWRGSCRKCRGAWRSERNRADRQANPPPIGPLEAARAERAVRATVGQLAAVRSQLAAVLADNERLQKELDTAAGLGAPEIRPIGKLPRSKTIDAVACVVASDWHVEEVVKPEQVNGLNRFDPGVAESRSQNFFRNALKLVNGAARDSKIDTIHLSLLGDFFSGWIHEELAESNALAPADAAEHAASLLASGIAYWLEESEFTIVGDALPGNHGRLTRQIRHANVVGTSLESFMYRRVLDRFRDEPRVQIRASLGGRTYREFFGGPGKEPFRMRLIHGYEIGYQGGIGGVSIPIRKKIANWEKGCRSNLTVMGHFHQLLNGGDFIVNGSLIGYTPYAEFLGASPEQPQQSFFLVHARKGGQVATTAPIWVD
jgi:hypothetical protein